MRAGRDLLVALVAGFETAARIAAGVDYPAFRKRGWHGPGTIGPFGAAAAVGRLRGFGPDTMATAFGLAGSQSAGTFAAWGTPSVKFHQFRGALSGLMAALLAEQGFVATREFLTARRRRLLSDLLRRRAHGKPRRSALGSHWEMEQIALRPWPTSAASQGVVTALFDLMREHDLTAERTERLRVYVSPACRDAYASRRTFSGKWEASASIHYTAAVVLHDRALWMEQFERYDDPQLRHFAKERVDLIGRPGAHRGAGACRSSHEGRPVLSAHVQGIEGHARESADASRDRREVPPCRGGSARRSAGADRARCDHRVLKIRDRCAR